MNLSTTKKIEYLALLDLGKPTTKSMDMSVQGEVGIGKRVYNPWFKTLDLAL